MKLTSLDKEIINIVKEKGGRVTIEEILDELDCDINIVQRVLASLSELNVEGYLWREETYELPL